MLLLTELHQLAGESQTLPLFSCIRCQPGRDTSTPPTTELQAQCVVVECLTSKGRLASLPGARRDPVMGNIPQRHIHPLALQR